MYTLLTANKQVLRVPQAHQRLQVDPLQCQAVAKRALDFLLLANNNCIMSYINLVIFEYSHCCDFWNFNLTLFVQ